MARVPEPSQVRKAELRKIKLADGDRPAEEIGDPISVDFNPDTLKVTYSNTVEGKDQRGGSAQQFVTKSNTKMAVELWFDVTRDAGKNDVRDRTKKVNQFLVPVQVQQGKDKKFVPPGVRFIWGSFLFDGVMESMDETLEFFSADGRPLRARVSVSISSQDIQFNIRPIPGAGDGTPGTSPRQQVRQGESVQQVASRTGKPDDWPKVAEANGIENPRLPRVGTFLKTSVSR